MWLQPSRRYSQWVEYFKLAILEIPNVRFGSIFLKPVTYTLVYKNNLKVMNLRRKVWDRSLL